MKNVAFIGAASGWGAQVRETEKGPEELQKSGVLSALTLPWIWNTTLYPLLQEKDLLSNATPLLYIEDICLRLAQKVDQILQEHSFPVVIGGDHSLAIGTWAGVAHQLKAKEAFGLIWVDAHMDAHTMDTTPSQAYHGMPLAALLGFGDPSLVHLLKGRGPVLNPAHVCLIGVRSYEEGEAALLQRLGVRIYYMQDVEERGFEVIFQEALEHIKKGTKGFGLSIDLDGFDPIEAPGVGSPESNGLKAQDVLSAFSRIQRDPLFKALEIVEYNPDRDQDQKTLFLMRDLLLALL